MRDDNSVSYINTVYRYKCCYPQDPQDGKGAAERLAATCKGHVRTYINEGNDVTTVEQLKDAILSYGGIEGVRVAATDSVNETGLFGTTPKIKGISKFNNFSFTSEGTRAWRAYGIGNGKVLTLKDDNHWSKVHLAVVKILLWWF